MPTTDNSNLDLNEEDVIDTSAESTPVVPVVEVPVVEVPVIKNDDAAKEANRRRMRHLGF
jgi:hypothetical protein